MEQKLEWKLGFPNFWYMVIVIKMHMNLLIKKKWQRVDLFLDIRYNIRENQERRKEYDKWIDNFKHFVKTKVF